MTGAKVIKTQCYLTTGYAVNRNVSIEVKNHTRWAKSNNVTCESPSERNIVRNTALLPSGKAQHFDCCIRWFESDKGSSPKWDSKNKHNRKEAENMENREQNENKEIEELKNKVEEFTKVVTNLEEMCKHTFSDVACVMMAADLLLRKNFKENCVHEGSLLREAKSCLQTISYAKLADSFYMQHALEDNPNKKDAEEFVKFLNDLFN